MQQTIRLDKFLANAGFTARRGVKQFLKEHEVTVDGKKVTESGTRVNTQTQTILIDSKKTKKPGFVYFLLNKPIGIISTTADEFGRDNVTNLVDTNERIYPVGRLDKDSHGLVLLTNDGELTHQLIHPRYHIPKVYLILVEGDPAESQLEKMRRGVMLDDGITMPASVEIIKPVIPAKAGIQHPRHPELVSGSQEWIPDQVGDDKEKTMLQITLHEGKNRQIRRMCEEVGIKLLDLQRIAFGSLKLGDLKKGEYRMLTKQEIQSLKDAVKKQTV